ncbi:hypothetical protein DM860_010273 [Cuscuta australis]|uniref:Auxin efflux carrier component n=1 Tax=Cuscuta australis TaxID=267555 RepID=A0A328DAV9_9ASTE|nr:hypothetical protein DM860_010273 [Cuscuta australis]
MITLSDFYHVMTAVVPLYVAMILAYGSVKWWKIFTPDQCSGINRFVALFAVPLLSFHFIASNDPYSMNLRFILADTLQKLIVLALVAVWANLSKSGSLEWSITMFSLSTLPNTLVMGIPLLKGMYGAFSGSLMVQIVVLQCIIWYTLMLFLFEFRGARVLISEQFPDTAGTIVSIHVDSDVMSLDGRQPLETDAEVKEDGMLHVTVRKSSASRSDIFSKRSLGGISSNTPRASNLTNAEIYSLQSSINPTPRGSSFNHTDFYSMVAGGRSSNFGPNEAYGISSASRGPTPRPSNYEEESGKPRLQYHGAQGTNNYNHNTQYPAPNTNKKPNGQQNIKGEDAGRGDLHMFVWSSSASPVSDQAGKDTRATPAPGKGDGHARNGENFTDREDICFGNRDVEMNKDEDGKKMKAAAMPPTSVMTRLILIMVWRKLIRNPNTYSSLLGLTWSLISFRWKNVKMPDIIAHSISILSDAGLGMAMFSLGLFMALQPRMIACGNSVASLAMAVRFLAGPAVMAAASFAVGLRGVLFHVAIVQAALPQGIVPFVFAKEYNVHPDILSTGVIFGMLIALPITLVYYILLGL